MDHLAAAADPRVIAVDRARLVQQRALVGGRVAVRPDRMAASLVYFLARAGITATEDQARDLLDALAAWDECMEKHKNTCDAREDTRTRLDAALDAIIGG